MRPLGLLVAAMLVGVGLPVAAASPGRAVRVPHHVVDDAPALGPRDALVTIELFFTPGARTSHDAYWTLIELQRRHPTRMRAVFRPLDRNTNTPTIVLAAHQRGRFFDLMNALSQSSIIPNAKATIDLAVKVGVDRSVAERAHLDKSLQAVLRANLHRSSRLGANSNPEFVINGRPLGSTLHAATATVDGLDTQYRFALDDARRAHGQGVPRHALVVWGERRARCGDDDLASDPLGDGADDDAGETEDGAPPSFAWGLADLILRGTGCAIVPHTPAALDEYNPDEPPRRRDAPLLAQPLPTHGVVSFGPVQAEVTFFVVCNLQARNCLDQLDRARRVSAYFQRRVRAVWVPWVDLALNGATHDLALAQAVLCAAGDTERWEFLQAASAAGGIARGHIDLALIAAHTGVDVDALATCASGEPRQARAVVEAARAAGIGYGPTVVIGGRAYLGGFSDDRRAIDRVAAELAPGLLEALIPSW